ncbi:MAG: putative DNA binding domain-containing protein [Bacilli bacterium]
MIKITEEEVRNSIKLIRKFKSETNNIEIKSAKEGFSKKCYDTISSFSNTDGGIIIFGINENKDFLVEGVYNVNDMQKKLTTFINDTIFPKIRFELLIMTFEEKNILAIKIKEIKQSMKPCFYKPLGIYKGSYIRIGDRDDHLSEYEINNYISYDMSVQEDIKIVEGAYLDKLNEVSINNFVKHIKKIKPNFIKLNKTSILESCGIIKFYKGRWNATIAGVMLFAVDPQHFFPQCFLACTVFPGNQVGDLGDLGQRFDDNRRIEGTIEEMLESSLAFLRINMKNMVVISTETGIRKNISEFPMLALKESIMNALIHRDYSSYINSAFITVYKFDNRIEIQSPGKLYGKNKLCDLGTNKVMEVRNKNIVRILEEKGDLVENRHTGIKVIKLEMQKQGLNNPVFFEDDCSFKITLFANNKLLNNNINTGEVDANFTGEVDANFTGEVDTKNPRELNKNPYFKNNNTGEVDANFTGEVDTHFTGEVLNKIIIYNSVNSYQKLLIKYCSKSRSMNEIAKFLNLNSRTYITSSILKPLIKSGLLEYTNKTSPKASNQKYISNKKQK